MTAEDRIDRLEAEARLEADRIAHYRGLYEAEFWRAQALDGEIAQSRGDAAHYEAELTATFREVARLAADGLGRPFVKGGGWKSACGDPHSVCAGEVVEAALAELACRNREILFLARSLAAGGDDNAALKDENDRLREALLACGRDAGEIALAADAAKASGHSVHSPASECQNEADPP